MAVTGGVHTPEDMVKAVAAGATIAMTTSSLLINGVDHIGTLLGGFQGWMNRNGYDSVQSLRGVLSHESVAEPGAFVRANYMHVLSSYVPRGQEGLSVRSHR
ncbi:MAG: hypothetical protein GF344_07380 [Chitinivibrionales bacterium]|nr:hypothetical protein [Chitinivibrionales bacterium]MBD3356729.1 hypothetical protein [Chitinivibrionales bacterium]